MQCQASWLVAVLEQWHDLHEDLHTTLQKKDTSVTFWAERIFFCHTYDTSMTKIVTKLGIIIDVVGSYFYDKKIMTENGLFILGGPETQLHDILWAVHDGKNRGRSEGEENFGEFPVTVGGRGPSDARFSRTRTSVCARRWL